MQHPFSRAPGARRAPRPGPISRARRVAGDGRTRWLQAIDREALVLDLYDWIEAMLLDGAHLLPPPTFAPLEFAGSAPAAGRPVAKAGQPGRRVLR